MSEPKRIVGHPVGGQGIGEFVVGARKHPKVTSTWNIKMAKNQNVRHQERLSVGVAHVLKGDLQFGQLKGSREVEESCQRQKDWMGHDRGMRENMACPALDVNGWAMASQGRNPQKMSLGR